MDLIDVILVLALFLLVFSPWIWRYKLRPRRAKTELRKLLQNHPQADTIIFTNSLLNTLYRGIHAERLSIRERKRLRLQDDALVYGEIDFLSFSLILNRVQPKPGEVFYDLGCGSGRALFVAALGYDLSKVVGVELLPGLCKLAQTQINKANTLVHLSDDHNKQQYLRRLSAIQVINANFLQVDFSDADLVFINATCIPYYTWEKILDKLYQLKPGSRVIVTTKKIAHDGFEVLYQGSELMSWGMNSLRIYRKIN